MPTESDGRALNERRQHERAKYLRVYETLRGYGREEHGRAMRYWLAGQNPRLVIDVGCGRNTFAKWLRSQGVDAVGLDFACNSADILIEGAHALPFADRSCDWITAFDVLEHLLPEEVPVVIGEMARVCSVGMLVSICYRDSETRIDGETLHPSVFPESWWIERLSAAGRVEKLGAYLVVWRPKDGSA